MEIISINKAKIAIEKPDNGDFKTAVIFIAGISGGVFTERFVKLKKVVLSKGYTFVPVEIWKDSQNAGSLTLREIFISIDDVINDLQERGYDTFYAVGKSFGGGMLLARNHPQISKLILWAPAIGVGDQSTIPDLYDVVLDKVASTSDIKLGQKELSNMRISVVILQGDCDEIVTKQESEKLASLIPNSHIEIIEGMGHSPKDEIHEDILMEKTLLNL